MAEWQPLRIVLPELAQIAASQLAPIQNPLPPRHSITPSAPGGLSRKALLSLVSFSLVFVVLGGAGVVWGLRQRNESVQDFSASPVSVQPRTADVRAESQGALGSPFLETKAKAEKGDVKAQDLLGESFMEGQGVEQNFAEAVKWFRRAADQNYAPAQHKLGGCYAYGHGVATNQTEAVKWYRKAAEQEFAPAQTSLGMCYKWGLGVERDYTEALKWYFRAANQNDARAQWHLSGCYERGMGVKQDHKEAVKWCRKAAEQGEAIAQLELAWHYDDGKGVERDYAEGVKWYRKAAEQNDGLAQSTLGHRYQNGLGVAKDYTEAYAWLNLAAIADEESAKARDTLERTMTQQQIAAGQKRSKELQTQIAAKLAERLPPSK